MKFHSLRLWLLAILKKLTIVMLNPPQAGFSIYPFAEWTQNPTFIRLRQISQVSG